MAANNGNGKKQRYGHRIGNGRTANGAITKVHLNPPSTVDSNGIPLPKLRGKELRFVADYAIHFNGAHAIRAAGYKGALSCNPSEYARELLRKPDIQAHIDHEIKQLGELHFRLHEENVGRLTSMRDADRTAIFDADGNILDPQKWPEACKHLLCGIEIEEEVRGEGEDAYLVRIKKVRLETPRAIVDSLAKITGQWIERSQWIGKDGKPVDPANVQPVLIVSYGDKLPEKEI